MTKRTPKQIADDLLWQGFEHFVPPVKRYTGARSDDWAAEYAHLLQHHEQETRVLLAVIEELVKRSAPRGATQ